MCIPWLERANDYSGNNLCKHIRQVGCYARQLLHLLEAVEVREKVDGEADGGTRRTWQDVAERTERLRQQGEAAATLVLAQVQAAERPSTRTSPYTVADVARQLHTSPDTVRGWIKSGQLAAANLATGSRPRYVITKADLDAFLKSRRPQPTSSASVDDKQQIHLSDTVPRYHALTWSVLLRSGPSNTFWR